MKRFKKNCALFLMVGILTIMFSLLASLSNEQRVFAADNEGISTANTYYLVSKKSNKCMDVADVKLDDGANIIQYTWQCSDNQKWKLEDAGDGYFKITAAHSGKCISVSDGGREIVQLSWTGSDSQKWKFEKDEEGYYKIVNKASGKCLDVAGASTGDKAQIIQYQWKNADNQKWKVVKDCSDWMKELSPYIKNSTMNNIILPGTHDSGTSSAASSSSFSPDATDVIKKINWMGSGTVAGLARTQDKNIGQQLQLGVRYFDLRVAPNPDCNNELYFVHSKYGDSVSSSIKDVKSFLDKHDGEVVVLDFQHFYNMNEENYNELMKLLKDNLGEYLAPATSSTLNGKTLKRLCDKNQRVIVIFNDSAFYACNQYNSGPSLVFKRSEAVSSPWIQKEWNSSTIIPKLQDGLDGRPDDKLFVSQCISSFSDSRYVDNFIKGYGIYDFAKDLNPEIIKWVKNNPSQKSNIIMVDYCDYPCNFVEDIINCNKK